MVVFWVGFVNFELFFGGCGVCVVFVSVLCVPSFHSLSLHIVSRALQNAERLSKSLIKTNPMYYARVHHITCHFSLLFFYFLAKL